MKSGKSPKNGLIWPSNFEGDIKFQHMLEILDNGVDKLTDLFYLGHKFGLRTDVAWTMHSFGPCGIVVWGNWKCCDASGGGLWHFCQHTLLAFVHQYVSKWLWIFFFHKIQTWYIILNDFHLNLCKDQELSTSPCLHPLLKWIFRWIWFIHDNIPSHHC
jgi:hypothetical protein